MRQDFASMVEFKDENTVFQLSCHQINELLNRFLKLRLRFHRQFFFDKVGLSQKNMLMYI